MTTKKRKTLLARLEIQGDPDDGMIPVYTGCINGNGVESVTVLDENRIVHGVQAILDALEALRQGEWHVTSDQETVSVPLAAINRLFEARQALLDLKR